MRADAVILCALSAHTRPLKITLSIDEICASRAAFAAALNRFTFCCGVSPTGPGFLEGATFEGRFELAGVNLAEA
jgi:hypothetical protein